MNLPKNIYQIPPILAKLPIVRNYRGMTLGSVIFFRPDIYQNLISKNPTPENAGILIHEQTHVKRIRKSNWVLWGIKYWLIPKFRFDEEMAATKAHMKYLKSRNAKFDIESRAKALSGWGYLWPVSYKTAKRGLERLWSEMS